MRLAVAKYAAKFGGIGVHRGGGRGSPGHADEQEAGRSGVDVMPG